VRSILCALDLTALSGDVLSMAAELAEAHDASLNVLHVVELWDSRYDFIVAEIEKKIEKDAHEKLRAELARLGRRGEVPVTVTIVKGQAGVRIIEAIRVTRPDLVVMGSHGHSKVLDRVLLGSVAEKIMRLSPVSVLVVRPLKNPDIKTIVCAVDFSDCSRTALEHAIELARLEKIPSIRVLNVYEVPMGCMEAGMSFAIAVGKTSGVHAREMDEFLKPHTDCGVDLIRAIEEGSPSSTMAAYAEKNNADLIVVGSHGRSALAALLFGGVSSRLVHQASVPVLAVKSAKHHESLWQALDKL
jgi:nucleotide-binding universal stress UspA family protein